MRALIAKEPSGSAVGRSSLSSLSLNTFSALHSESRDIWLRLWQYPELPLLVRGLLKSFDPPQWNWNAASLLNTILEIQTLYQQYLRTSNPDQPHVFADGVLLSLDDVGSIIEVFSGDLIRYHTHNFDSALNRELQFKVLGTALDLSKLLGASQYTHEYYQSLRSRLKDRQNDILNGRGADKTLEFSFGDGEVLIRNALDSLAETPGDVKTPVTVVKGCVNVIFAAGLVYTCNAPQALQCLQIFQELPDSPSRGYKSLQELGSWSLGAICLMRYSRAMNRGPESEKMNQLACNIVGELLRKFERPLQNQFQHLLQQSRPQNMKNVLARQLRHAAIEVPVDNFHGILGLLYLVDVLATECGHLSCFDGVKDFCVSAHGLSLNKAGFKILRLKLLEVLLSIEYSRTENACLEHILHSKLRKQDVTGSQIKPEISTSIDRFNRKKELQNHSRKYAIKQLDDSLGGMFPGVPEYGFFRPSSFQTSEQQHIQESPKERKHAGRKMIKNLTQPFQPPHNPFRPPKRVETLPPEPESNRYAPLPAPNRSMTTPLVAPHLTPPPTPGRSRHLPGDSPILPHLIAATVPSPPLQNSRLPHHAPLSVPSPPPSNPRTLEQTPSSAMLAEEMLHTLEQQRQAHNNNNRGARISNEGYSPISPMDSHNNISLSPVGEQRWPRAESPTSFYSEDMVQNRQLNLSTAQVSTAERTYLDLSPRSRQLSRTSFTSSNTGWSEMPSGMSIDRTELQEPTQISFFKRESKALHVSISPNGRYAAFAFKHFIQLTQLSGQTTRSEIMMADKKESFEFVALSDDRLVACTAKSIRSCAFDNRLQPPASGCISIHHVDHTIAMQCVAIARDSSLIAVGQRIIKDTNKGREIKIAVQLFNPKLAVLDLLDCSIGEYPELLKSVAFNVNTSTVIGSCITNAFSWTNFNGRWERQVLDSVRCNGEHAKGITSINPLYSWTPSSSIYPEGIPLPNTQRQYYLTTTILSRIRDQSSTFISPLMPHPPMKSFLDDKSHFHRATISTDSLLAAFLTDEGRLKLACIVPNKDPSTGGLMLKEIRTVPNSPWLQKESHPEYAGRLHIKVGDAGHTYVVTGIDRRGKVMRLVCHASWDQDDGPNKLRYGVGDRAVAELAADVPQSASKYAPPRIGTLDMGFGALELSAVPASQNLRAPPRMR